MANENDLYLDFLKELDENDTGKKKVFWLINILQFSLIPTIITMLTLHWDQTSGWDRVISSWMIGESIWRIIVMTVRLVALIRPCLIATTTIRVIIWLKLFIDLFLIIGLSLSFRSEFAARIPGSHMEYVVFVVMWVDIISSWCFSCSMAKTASNYQRRLSEVPVVVAAAVPEVVTEMPAVMPTLNIDNYVGPSNQDDDLLCPICLSEFIVGETIKILPCKHFYHRLCIDKWFERKLTCPKCKRDIV